MGIADRDYMKEDYKGKKKKSTKPGLWSRFKFWLYLLFRPKNK
ncbi:MAG: hypothetical protein OEZ36_13850 [Spirochaetota bacterium]|nr:hypothetical protein [Spirochaetota bacterium]